ncbi:MAG: glycosyltransferase family 39 protein [Myxococcales bacterium]
MTRARALAGAVALGVLVLHLATSGRYGIFRDELYFLACGRHLQWGYVDQPPLIAVVARASEAIAGRSLVLLRLTPALAHAALTLLAGFLAVRLSGSRFAALLAALCVATAPVLQIFGYLLSMNAFEPLFWTGAATLVLLAAQRDDPRFLLPAGAVLGVGLLNKFSMAFGAVALLGGVVLTRERRLLRSRFALAGAALAVAIALPTLFWQWRAGFPQLELLRNGQLEKNAPIALSGFALGQLLNQGPLSALVWLPGLWMLLRGRIEPRARFLGLGFVLAFVIIGGQHGKAYYLAPAFPVLFAAGGVQLERWLRPAAARTAAGLALTAQGALLAPLVLPLLSPAGMIAWSKRLGAQEQRTERHRYNELPQHIADQFGWQGMVAKVAVAWERIPPSERARAAIFGQNYGESGAVDFFGPAYGLPAALGRHNEYWRWSRARIERGPPIEVAVVIGDSEPRLRQIFAQVERVATHSDPFAMPYESDLPIWLCRGPKVSLPALWQQVRLYI